MHIEHLRLYLPKKDPIEMCSTLDALTLGLFKGLVVALATVCWLLP